MLAGENKGGPYVSLQYYY